MAHTLYRKYRPQVFDDIVGQNHIKVTLLSELLSGRVAHAYLFSGPRGVGKTTVARLLAKSVNCLHPRKDGGPDNRCDACQEIREGRSLDLIEIDAASHTGVDHVREQVIENSRFTPSRWKYKVFIIDEVHMLSLSAFNALLKTLEEPPAHALFILATTEIHKVPETIVSRCQRFDFRRLRHEDLLERLQYIVKQEKVTVEKEVLDAIARFARGSSRDAENLLAQVLTLGDTKISQEQAELVLPRSDLHLVIELFDALVAKDSTAAITIVNRLVQEGVNLSQFVQNAIEFFRKALLLKVNSQLDLFSTLELPKDEEKAILEKVERISLEELEKMITVFLDREQYLRASFIPQLPLEMAVLELTAPDESTQILEQRPPKSTKVPSTKTQTTSEKAKTVEKTPRSSVQKPRPKIQNLPLERIREQWPTILEHLQKRNHSLRLTLNVAAPIRIDEAGVVTLGVGFEFHRERLADPKSRQIIEETFTEILGQPISIRAEVTETIPKKVSFEQEENVEIVDIPENGKSVPSPAKGNTDKTWNALIEAFGGGKS